MKIKGRIIALRANESKSGRSMVMVTDNKMLVISKTVFNACVNGEVDEVEFEENGNITTADGSNMPSFAVKDYTDSIKGKLRQAKDLCDYAEGVDADKVKNAVALGKDLKF